MRTGRRTIQHGQQFDLLFAKSRGEFVEIKKYAQLKDTVSLMKEVITTTLEDTRTISKTLRQAEDYESLRRVWQFCFSHLQYKKDQAGIEQVRRPIRSWQDRHTGVDCDCMTVFIGSILTNLKIPFLIRLTRYVSSEFEHVYPVALIGDREVIMDCVVHKFDYEVPYKSKQDISMKLQYLNGISDDDEDFEDDLNAYPPDAQALFWADDDLEGLDGKAKRQEKKAARKEKREERKEVRQEKREERKENKVPLKEKVKNVVHVVNKVNPATALLRAGVLASMKLNIGNVAAKLRFSYWSDAQAAQNNMDMAKFAQLKTIRVKLEKIFHGAGGEPENLKKAILEGNGNKDKRVSLNGLGAIIQPANDYQSLYTILGDEIYAKEFSTVENVNGIGEPISATAAVAAASGVIGTIAALIAKIGELFKKGSPQAEKDLIQTNTSTEEDKSRKFSLPNIVNKIAPMMDKLAPLVTPSLPVPQTQPAPTPASTDVPAVVNPNAPSDSTPSYDIDYDEIDEASESMPATVEDEMPAESTSADEIDPTLPEASDFEPANSKIISKSESGSESGGVMQWIKDHPMLTLVGVVTATAATVAIVRAVKKSKQKPKSLQGLNGPKGQKRKTKKRKGPTPSKRRSTGFRKVELQ